MMFHSVADFFSFIINNTFILRALAVGVLIALSAALLGVVLVLKRFSFIGDGLSHVAFGAMAIASVVGLSNNLLLVLPITVISAILLLRTGQNTKIKGDAAIAMISVGALAVGYLVMSAFSASSNFAGDVCGTLFGSVAILTLSDIDVYLCLALSALVIGFFLLFKNKIFAVTFDESFAKTAGLKTSENNNQQDWRYDEKFRNFFSLVLDFFSIQGYFFSFFFGNFFGVFGKTGRALFRL